jgi:hypothetical protein
MAFDMVNSFAGPSGIVAHCFQVLGSQVIMTARRGKPPCADPQQQIQYDACERPKQHLQGATIKALTPTVSEILTTCPQQALDVETGT